LHGFSEWKRKFQTAIFNCGKREAQRWLEESERKAGIAEANSAGGAALSEAPPGRSLLWDGRLSLSAALRDLPGDIGFD
jgi:hypothetical protein